MSHTQVTSIDFDCDLRTGLTPHIGTQETYFIEWDAKVELFDAEQGGSRTPKRVPMACTFCRKRKLKCDGRKTSCGNCERRNIPCSYIPVAEDKNE
ncbi:hypothetical protein BXZ70DRAFT_1013029 [Cristinia sonorae]|uniref:Zn(2)-C6 fungal-type domain-containing protein n=1 Tax=Cristinia sonorae TaxID=1940300 RepID=A0A8K0UFC4_9AGAR|nr:hypothetical protein BXZ70DRAFT_1013029 [Cristinia sonorae]